jgi:hypothetical protein
MKASVEVNNFAALEISVNDWLNVPERGFSPLHFSDYCGVVGQRCGRRRPLFDTGLWPPTTRFVLFAATTRAWIAWRDSHSRSNLKQRLARLTRPSIAFLRWSKFASSFMATISAARLGGIGALTQWIV